MPWIEASDWPAARTWAEFEFLSGQIYAALHLYGVTNPKGEARRLLDDYRKLRCAQALWARELGLTPASRQALKAAGTNSALDLAALCARVDEPEAATGEGVMTDGGA